MSAPAQPHTPSERPPATPRSAAQAVAGQAAAAEAAVGTDGGTAGLVEAIDALLPQTQCGQCGHGGCLPYARAMAGAAAPINRCPPGGDAVVADLARLLGRPVIALDPSCGTPRPLHVAVIDETRCIGCTLCIQACPVDAIVGATKAMHTVVAAECTGCDLCLPPCPMDCIQMVAVQPPRPWTRADADQARRRLHERARRLARAQADQEERLVAKARHKLEELQARSDLAQQELGRRRAIVEQALERVRQRRARDGA